MCLLDLEAELLAPNYADLHAFFRQCLLDAYSITECPKCNGNLISLSETGEQQLLCDLKNEGGLQEGLDILPILTEESYLKAYPEERRCRAFLEFCAEGDVEAIVDLLQDTQDDEEERGTSMGCDTDILRYQDQIGSLGSGLHVAVKSRQVEVAWLLLFLASNLAIDRFPKEVLQTVQEFELLREDQSLKVDIRSLRDAEGNTAEHYAANTDGAWDEWLNSGRLRPPATPT